MIPLERAFELAATGKFRKVEELVRALSNEGYWTNQVEGPRLKKQLTAIMAAARAKSDNLSSG